MSSLKDQISYISGMIEGMKIDTSEGEGAVIQKILDVLRDMAVEIETLSIDQNELRDDFEDLQDEVDDIEDLVKNHIEEDDLEERFDELFHRDVDDEDEDDDDEDDDDEDDFEDDEDFVDDDGYDEDDDDGILTRCICPKCGRQFLVPENERTKEALFKCPFCGEKVPGVADFEVGEDWPIVHPETDE